MNRHRGRSGFARMMAAAGVVTRVVAAVAVAALLSASAVATWRWVRQGERFLIRDVAVTGAQRASADEVVRASGIVRGRNIFLVDTARAAAAIERMDWIAHAKISRSLPDRIRIVVEERHPVAVVPGGRLFVVDEDGVRIKSLAAQDGLDLPVVSGLGADDFGAELRPATPEALTALKVLSGIEKHGTGGLVLSELHVSDEGGETVYTAWLGQENPVELRLGAFGADPVAEVGAVLDRFHRIWAELQRENQIAQRIDLGNRQRADWVGVKLAARP